jgi:hypothetical protein
LTGIVGVASSAVRLRTHRLRATQSRIACKW